METPPYFGLQYLVEMIEGHNGLCARRLLEAEGERFGQAPGSTYNHQAWPGGYWDHVTEAMNLAVLFYAALQSTGRFDQLEPEERFTQSDALLVVFLHDLEKPWCIVERDGKLTRDKSVAHEVRWNKIREWEFRISPMQENALHYIEGIRDGEYTPGARLMRPLGALCAMCDLFSARGFYQFPLAQGDAWGQRLAGFTA